MTSLHTRITCCCTNDIVDEKTFMQEGLSFHSRPCLNVFSFASKACVEQVTLQISNKLYVGSAATTWEAAGSHSGSARPTPIGQSISGWCSGSCCCCGSADSRTPTPPRWTAWSPHRPWCSPLLAGQNRRCQTSQTPGLSPGLCCCRSAGSPWFPPPKRCPPWQW